MTGVCLTAPNLLQEKGQLVERNLHLEAQLHAAILREIAMARNCSGLRRQLSVSKQEATDSAQQVSAMKLHAAYAASELQVGQHTRWAM